MIVLVFDLDDTLYKELDFVMGGFRDTAKFLQNEYSLSKEKSFFLMKQELKNGRGKIFNNILKRYDIYNKTILNKCIKIYRTHNPRIKLYISAKKFLTKFTEFPIYIVTDGNKNVQKSKINALGLQKRIKFSYLTSNYGLKNSKPSTYCFSKICEREKVQPKNVIYIADDPSKDFVNLKKHGFKTIRVLTGKYKNRKFQKEFEADFTVKSLSDLSHKVIKELIGK